MLVFLASTHNNTPCFFGGLSDDSSRWTRHIVPRMVCLLLAALLAGGCATKSSVPDGAAPLSGLTEQSFAFGPTWSANAGVCIGKDGHGHESAMGAASDGNYRTAAEQTVVARVSGLNAGALVDAKGNDDVYKLQYAYLFTVKLKHMVSSALQRILSRISDTNVNVSTALESLNVTMQELNVTIQGEVGSLNDIQGPVKSLRAEQTTFNWKDGIYWTSLLASTIGMAIQLFIARLDRRRIDAATSALRVRAIGNVAFNPEQAKAVSAASAVASVVTWLSSSKARVQLQTLCAMRNLAVDAPADFEVVAHGAIAQLVQLLCSESQQVQVQAAWVIGALALHEGANLQLMSAGVLLLLEALKYSTDIEARDAASQALGNLARVLTPNSRRVIEQDTAQLDRGGRAGGRRGNRRQSPLARAANATSVVWTSPLAGETQRTVTAGNEG